MVKKTFNVKIIIIYACLGILIYRKNFYTLKLKSIYISNKAIILEPIIFYWLLGTKRYYLLPIRWLWLLLFSNIVVLDRLIRNIQVKTCGVNDKGSRDSIKRINLFSVHTPNDGSMWIKRFRITASHDMVQLKKNI